MQKTGEFNLAKPGAPNLLINNYPDFSVPYFAARFLFL